MAGLDTMNLGHEINKVLALEELVPAVGQGVIAVQSLKDQNTVLLEQINHLETYQCAMAERNMLQMVDGDCDTAIGSITGRIGDIISLEAYNYENNKSVKMQSKAIDYLNLGELAGNKIK
jgi:hydroxymethylbilane synthase